MGAPLYRVMTFSQFLYREFVDSQFLSSLHFSHFVNCEGDGNVVGVVLLRGSAQVVLHGVQVVELSVLLGVHQDGEVEEDGEGQVEVER